MFASIWAYIMANPTKSAIAAFWVLSAAVNAMPSPQPNSSMFYQFVFKFTNSITGSIFRALASRLPASIMPNTTKAIAFLVLLVGSGLMLGGCNDPYGACVKGGNAIAKAITAAMPTVDQLHTDNLISAQEDLAIEGYLKFANDADGVFLSCASVAKANGGKPGTYTACATTFSASLNSPDELALVKVTNPQTQQTVTGIINGITAGIASISASLGGA